VRLASLQALAHVYKAFDEIKDLTPVRHFTERFESRLLSMIKDVDDSVAVEAIRLVTRLQACHHPECFLLRLSVPEPPVKAICRSSASSSPFDCI